MNMFTTKRVVLFVMVCLMALFRSGVAIFVDHVPEEVCSLPTDSEYFTQLPKDKVDFENFEAVPIYNDEYYKKYCPKSSPNKFANCDGPLKNVKIFTGLNIEESVEQSTTHFDVIQDPENGHNTSYIARFTGHLFAIPDAYINMWGQTFDFTTRRRYLSGRCADLPEKPIYPISSKYDMDKTLNMNGVVLNLVIPWSFVYGHELMEILGILMVLKPLIQTCPHIHIIGFHGLTHTKLFPLLHAAGINPKSIKILPIYQKEWLVHAKWVIVPVFPCLYIPQNYLQRLHHAMNLLPFHTNYTGNNIVFHDRRKQHPQRDIPEGPALEAALRSRYESPSRKVTVIYGSESLEETIRLMREASVFISVHGSATANMIFMRPNTTYVEISPRFYNFDCMLAMANAVGMIAYDYEALSGVWQSSAHVNLTVLQPKVFEIIDAQDRRDGYQTHFNSSKYLLNR